MPTSLTLFIAPIFALSLSIFLGIGILHFFPKWGILDRPLKYGHTRKPIPYPGGIAIFIAFTITILLFLPLDFKMIGFLCGGALLTVVSFTDDRYGVSPILRLFLQIFVTGILIWSGTKIVYISDPLGGTAFELTPFFSTVITVMWVIILINTLNWLDGVPGVASGASALSGIFLGVLSLTPLVNQQELAAMGFIFGAANLGFTFFNFPPPKMLNGDTGAMFSGFAIAAFSIFSGGKMATAFLVLAIPLFDAASVVFHRLRQKKSPFHGNDKRHLHDELLKKGWKEIHIMVLFLGISSILGVSTLYLRTLGKIIILGIIGIVVFALSWQNQKK
ncbi:undecaprenyl/decaprenyl-phosphate alpha-N-acetylglucosaminyl 1-phosphate transferase [Candidatus Peregrinibacteria bacterium]|nr:undecaprenyl/decaprenyl-phosphate alpha-N-acetylglucosaminyl 1-phosphate transferase [Candidatus Peregrinibacteria bacterium]